jgi:hypothetical protein
MTDEMPVMSKRTITYDFKRILTSHVAVADRHIGIYAARIKVGV